MPGLPRGADHIYRTAGIPEDGIISLPRLPRMREALRHAPAGSRGITRTQEASANMESLYSTDLAKQADDEFIWPERAQ